MGSAESGGPHARSLSLSRAEEGGDAGTEAVRAGWGCGDYLQWALCALLVAAAHACAAGGSAWWLVGWGETAPDTAAKLIILACGALLGALLCRLALLAAPRVEADVKEKARAAFRPAAASAAVASAALLAAASPLTLAASAPALALSLALAARRDSRGRVGMVSDPSAGGGDRLAALLEQLDSTAAGATVALQPGAAPMVGRELAEACGEKLEAASRRGWAALARALAPAAGGVAVLAVALVECRGGREGWAAAVALCVGAALMSL